MSRVRWIALGVIATMGVGCYSYVPVALDDVPPGTHVRAHIRGSTAADLRQLGADWEHVDGRLIERGNEQLVVEILEATSFTTGGARSLSQRIDLPVQDVVSVQVRRLDGLKTGIAAALAAGGLVTFAFDLFGIMPWTDESTEDDTDGETEHLRVPFRISVP